MKTFVIAEAGANHDRKFEQAINLIDVAKGAGASAVKFQTYSSETLYSSNTPDFAGYKNINKLIKDIELPRHWQKELKQYCDDTNIEFMSTPFDESAVEELVDLGVKRLKIAGFESTDPRFVRMVASTKLPIIFSAGIGSTLTSIQETIRIIREEYEQADITVLHCNNAYPTPIEDINLNQLDKIKERFLPVKMGAVWFRNYGTDQAIKMGLSDHTLETFTPSLAVAKGATCIEKHFTLCNSLEGPDHKFAMPPEKLRIMIDMIKETELMCQSTNHSVTHSEKQFTKAMRSVVACKDIKKGERLTLDNLTTKRPFLEDCIAAKDYYHIIDNIAACDIQADQILKESDVNR